MTILDPSSNLESKIRFASLMGVQCISHFGFPVQGDVFKDGVIYRFKNGLLDGGIQEAISCADGHIEYWTKGQPDRNYGYAVISDYGRWVEEWKKGKLLVILPRVSFSQ
jgi:hypothetical protein